MTKFPSDRPRFCISQNNYALLLKCIENSDLFPPNCQKVQKYKVRCAACDNHIYPSASTTNQDSSKAIPIYMCMHIQQHSGKFRVFGDRLHLGAISIPFKQVTARMKLISLRLLRMQCIPEAVFHCSLISSFFGKVYKFNR